MVMKLKLVIRRRQKTGLIRKCAEKVVVLAFWGKRAVFYDVFN